MMQSPQTVKRSMGEALDLNREKGNKKKESLSTEHPLTFIVE